MADKIKILKEDIEAGIYELPEGYSFKKVKTKSEQIAELTAELNLLEITHDSEPSEEVLREHSRLGAVHPFYLEEDHINDLKRRITELQKA